MSASDARSISVTMSVPVVLVPTSSAGPAEARRAAAPRPIGRPARRGRAARRGRRARAHRARPLGSARARSSRPRRPAQRHGHPTDAGDAPGDGRGRGGRRRLRRRPDRRPARGGLRRAGRQGGVAVRAVRHDGQPDRAAAARAARAPWCWWVAASTSSCGRRRRPAATPPPSSWRSTTPTARSTRTRWRGGWPTRGSGWAEPSAVFVEDTHGEVGGRVWPLERLAAVAAAGLPMHLDGARLWNAAVASGTSGRRAGRGGHHRHVLRVEGPGRAGRLAAGRARPT